MNNFSALKSVRRLGLAFAVASSSLVSVAAASQPVSAATDPITVVAPTLSKSYTTNRNEWVPAFKVKNATQFNLLVSVSFESAPAGTKFSVDQPGKLSLKYGYAGWRNVSSVAFSGKTTDVNRALASLKLHTTSKGKVTFKVTATADDTQLAYEPISNHYYGFVSAPHIKWTEALAAASALSFRGVPAYLAAINSEVENDFVSYNIENASNVWIAATDKDTEGDFKWVTGEAAGKTFWKARCAVATGADSCTGANSVDNAGTYKNTNIDNPLVNTYSSWDRSIGRWGQNYEPNNWSGDEDYVVTNWSGSVGLWNDLKDTDTTNIAGYVVEYAPTSGELFTGVVQAKASYDVVTPPSKYQPSRVLIAKNADATGTVRLQWFAPKTSIPQGRFNAKLKRYYVTSSVRGGEKFCTDAESQKTLKCSITGFLPGQELSFVVNAEYTKSPTGGFLGLGQKVFGAGVKADSFDYSMFARLDAPTGRPVRTGAKVSVSYSGLKPGSVFTVKADGVLVATGMVGNDGTVPSGKSFAFPTANLEVTPEWGYGKVLYTFDAVKADGSAISQSVAYLFKGPYLVYTTGITPANLSIYTGWPVKVIPHTAIAG